MSRLHTENHLVSRIGWLRAAVLEGPCNNQRQDKEKQEFTTYRRASQGFERTAKIFACDVAKIGKTSLALIGISATTLQMRIQQPLRRAMAK